VHAQVRREPQSAARASQSAESAAAAVVRGERTGVVRSVGRAEGAPGAVHDAGDVRARQLRCAASFRLSAIRVAESCVLPRSILTPSLTARVR
jgi:hypothetical protein